MTNMVNRELKVAWLFPNILYLHGERGNIKALKRIAAFADIEVFVEKVSYDYEGFDPNNFDIIFCAPGEIVMFPAVVNWLKPYKAKFEEFIEKGKVLLVTGTSQAIFGKETKREEGQVVEGLGLINATYEERKYVYGDDIHFVTSYSEEEKECMGVQVQMVNVITDEEPFGHLLYGFGNTGNDRNEGVRKNNSIFTNVLGPMLVQNPWITKEIIINAAKNKGIEIESFELDTTIEEKSIATKKNFIANKKTKLTNCK